LQNSDQNNLINHSLKFDKEINQAGQKRNSLDPKIPKNKKLNI
jgi:hypothetical protein